MNEYITIRLPKKFIEYIEKEVSGMCFNSRAEMTKTALREMAFRFRAAMLRIPYDEIEEQYVKKKKQV
jgi:hypothetical protein